MKREDATTLYQIYARALDVLGEADPILRALSKDKEGKEFVDAHRDVIMGILSKLRAPLVIQYRDLNSEIPEGPPDTELEQLELEEVGRLTPEQIERIDNVLLSECTSSWNKVAKVVGMAMLRLNEEFSGLPDGYCAQRIALLVARSQLVSQGNLDYMRFSEVRLPS